MKVSKLKKIFSDKILMNYLIKGPHLVRVFVSNVILNILGLWLKREQLATWGNRGLLFPKLSVQRRMHLWSSIVNWGRTDTNINLEILRYFMTRLKINLKFRKLILLNRNYKLIQHSSVYLLFRVNCPTQHYSCLTWSDDEVPADWPALISWNK